MTISVRSIATAFKRTPFHPQWLLGRRSPPPGIGNASGTVLDIGAADRWIARHLPVGTRYLALDHPAIGGAIYRASPDVFADGSALPFSDGSIDCVTCLEVLEHVAGPAVVMSEISRVLRPGGRAWISMPFLYPVHDAPFDFQRYTRYGLRRDIERTGLQIVSMRQTGSAVRTAGMLCCLAVAGGVYRPRSAYVALLPVAALLVLLVNVLAWALSLVWPDWDGMSAGLEAEIRKP